MKVTIIGGGSSYTPELIIGFLERINSFPLTDLWLVDVSPERLEIVGNFSQRMVKAHGAPFSIHLTTNQKEGIDGANYIITQLRVGGMSARREDEYLGRRHNLIGQETTGVGGMSKALRTIPIMLDIAGDIETLSPDALLINFTNPAGLITEALSRYAPSIKSVGVCNVPVTAKMEILEQLENELGSAIDPERVELDTLGLNHLSWHRGFTVDDKDVWPLVMASFLENIESDDEWDLDTITELQLIPNYYLQYYYYTDRKLKAQQEWPPSRAEEVMVIEESLLTEYAEPDRSQPPEGLMDRGGAYYSTMATQLLNAHFNDLDEPHVVNIPHRGAVPEWPEDWVLEMPCKIGCRGIEPIPAEPLPAVCFDLIAQVKSYELLTIDAAVYGDHQAAYQALMVHPLGPPADKIQDVFDDMLKTNQDHLPQF